MKLRKAPHIIPMPRFKNFMIYFLSLHLGFQTLKSDRLKSSTFVHLIAPNI